jgi:zeaxanthin glucosyltransferase
VRERLFSDHVALPHWYLWWQLDAYSEAMKADTVADDAGRLGRLHFAFIAPPFAGHFNPLQAVASELVRREHRASFFHQVDAAGLLNSGQIRFSPVGLASHPAGSLGRLVRQIGGLRGIMGMAQVIRPLAACTEMLCRELPSTLQAHGIDAIVADQTEAAGGLVARHIGVPYISMASALPINSEANMPPPFTGWPYDPTRWGRHRNRGGYRVSRWLMRPLQKTIHGIATSWGLGPVSDLEDCLSPYAQISQLSENLDFPRSELPVGFHYTGPWRDEDDTATLPFRPADYPRKLVFVSLGTLQGNRFELFEAIATACCQLNLQCVIAHGGRMSLPQSASLPGQPLVFDFLPQRQLLRHAAAVVTHGGMNTVLDAAAAGVPTVVVPLAFEQAAIAARVAHAGVGRVVNPRRPLADEFARALKAVLEQPAYADRARAMQHTVVAAGGAFSAASIIEDVIAKAICDANSAAQRRELLECSI